MSRSSRLTCAMPAPLLSRGGEEPTCGDARPSTMPNWPGLSRCWRCADALTFCPTLVSIHAGCAVRWRKRRNIAASILPPDRRQPKTPILGRATGVRTAKVFLRGRHVVNCAGAWAAQIQPFGPPTRPVKGTDGLRCAGPSTQAEEAAGSRARAADSARQCARPRSTSSPAAMDASCLVQPSRKRASTSGWTPTPCSGCIRRPPRRCRRSAKCVSTTNWAGLRPGSPDGLPILGADLRCPATTPLPDIIATASCWPRSPRWLMTQLLTGNAAEFDLAPFSPLRFG